MEVKPQLVTRGRGRYTAVDIDLWRTGFNLSNVGQEKARIRIEEEVAYLDQNGGLKKGGSVTFSAGATFVGCSKVFKTRADAFAHDLLRIINTHAVPISWDDHHEEKGNRMSTVLHKDGDQYAIVTEAKDEPEFVAEISQALSDLSGTFNTEDGPYELSRWIPLAFEISCKFRGYKALVTERRTIIAGQLDPNVPLVSAGRVAEGSVEEKG